MSAKDQDVLEVVDTGFEFRLQWWIPENEDYGATVGESGKEPVKDADTDLEWYTAEMVAFKLYRAKPDSDTFGLDKKGFRWASKSAATKVLAQIKAETRAALQSNKGSEKGWPEWATTALSNGWKPPKGWKP